MNFVDVLIIVLIVALAVRGEAVGLVRQVCSVTGFIVGLFIGAWILPHFATLLPESGYKPLLVAAGILLVAVGCGSIGELGASWLELRLHWKAVVGINRVLGAVFGIISALLVVWLVGSMLANSPLINLSQPIQQSKIIRFLDEHLPPVPNLLARAQTIFAQNGFPDVFTGLEPLPAGKAVAPPPAAVAAAALADEKSVVQIEGDGCGEEITGSGFVVSPGVVVTNAHVVAGVAHPVVADQTAVHRATVVYFNPNLDLAILKVPGLPDRPLTLISEDQPAGTPGAVLGYPGGGPYTAKGASILRELTAVGRNIYGTGVVARTIYQIQSDVEPGNSGGPLVLTNGQVIGIVFAKSLSTPDNGYALAGSQIAGPIAQGENQTTPVSTGACAD